MDSAAQRAMGLLRERGATSLDELVSLLEAEGVEVEDEDDLEDDLLVDGTVFPLPDGRLVPTGHILEGAVFTHCPGVEELTGDFLIIEPDLQPLTLADFDETAELAGGGRVNLVFDFDVFEDMDRPEVQLPPGRSAFLGPPGWLSELTPGDYIGLRWSEGRFEMTRLAADTIPPGPPAATDTLAAAYEHVVANYSDDDASAGYFDADFEDYEDDDYEDDSGYELNGYDDEDDDEDDDDDGPQPAAEIAAVVATALAESPDLFREPLPPLGDLFAACGLETHDEMVGLAGTDWDELSINTSLADVYGLDAVGIEGLRLLMASYRVYRLTGFDDPVADMEILATGLGLALSEPAVADAFSAEVLGMDGADVDHLARFATIIADAQAAARGNMSAGTHFILARCAEWTGDVEAGESALKAARQADPLFEPALLDSAWYAEDRGHAGLAADWLRHAGVEDDDPHLNLLQHYALPGPARVGRNEPCPCGSGRKYKLCCVARGGHTLVDRAPWLFGKAVLFLQRPPQRGQVLPVVLARAGIQDPRQNPAGVLDAITDPVVRELALFEGGLLERFLDVRAVLLPPDELALGRQWVGARHNLYEVLEIDPGQGIRLRDEVSGEEVSVREVVGSFGRLPGEHVFALVLSDGDAPELFGQPLSVPDDHADVVIQLLAENPSPEALARWLYEAHLPLDQPPGPLLERQAWLFPPTHDLSVLNPSDEDDRRMLIEADHSELLDAIDAGLDEIVIEGTVVNPRLHLAVHEIVANQVWSGDPAETWTAAKRLMSIGFDRHEVLHMLGSAVVEEIWQAQHEGNPYDHDRFVAALDALPEAWQASQSTPSTHRSHRRRPRNPHRPPPRH